jgi:ComF family protein
MSGIREAFLEALAFVLPVTCAGCGADDRLLCPACVARLRPDVLSRVLPDGTRVWAGLEYADVAGRVIVAFKEEGRTGIARALGPALRAAVEVAWREAPGAVLCPIPSSRASRRHRGYDAVGMLMDRAGLPAVRVFRTAAGRPSQKTLGREQRTENRSGAFRLGGPVRGMQVLLVDDVVTTGSTLAAAAGILRAAGAEVVGAVAVASTPRRYGRPSQPLSGSSATDP